LKYYYDVKMYGSGTYFNVDKNVKIITSPSPVALLPGTRWWMHVVQPGWKAKQIKVSAELSCSTSMVGKISSLSLAYWRLGTLSSLHALKYKLYNEGTLAKIDDVISANSSDIETINHMARPQFVLSGNFRLMGSFISGAAAGLAHTDTFNMKSWSLDFDVHTTSSILNEDLYPYTFQTNDGLSSGTYTYLDADNKGRKYINEPSYLVNTLGTGQLPITYPKDYQNFIGGVHYANAFGVLYNTLRNGAKEYGTVGITDADLIKVAYVGSKMVALWPNQKRIAEKNKNLLLQNAYGDMTDLALDENGWTQGQEFFVDGQYDMLNLWVYSNMYNNSGSVDYTVNLDVRTMQSPNNAGPMSVTPSLSASLVDDNSSVSFVKENTYRYSYTIDKKEGWRSYKLTFPLDDIKRFRVDVSGSSSTQLIAPWMKNAVIFGQFIKKDVNKTSHIEGDNPTVGMQG